MAKEVLAVPVSEGGGPSPAVLETRLKELFPEIPADQMGQLKTFYTEFQVTNRSITLATPSQLTNVESSLFFDSIRASRLIHPELVKGHPVLDLAGAAGFPGIILAILYPEISIQIVELDGKRSEFIKRVIAACALKNTSMQAADLEHSPVASIHNAILRGNPSLSKSLLGGRKSVAKGGKLFHIKGDSWTVELAALPSQLFSFWSPKLLGTYKLPINQVPMNVILTSKLTD